MNLQDGTETSESRFAAYVETLSSALDRADQVAPARYPAGQCRDDGGHIEKK
ncbi:hypothetical protein [Mesorhizobium sp. WSM2239]|uniref:Uncharacterized protein n=2 Tax=unclassified Mesorhizobium TaxID=325217 RepID=A0AAU8D636_9HYPH